MSEQDVFDKMFDEVFADSSNATQSVTAEVASSSSTAYTVPGYTDTDLDMQLYAAVSSIVGIMRKQKNEPGNDLSSNLKGMVKRYAKLTLGLSPEETLYWDMHLVKQKAREDV